jgi:hypothetical protein
LLCRVCCDSGTSSEGLLFASLCPRYGLRPTPDEVLKSPFLPPQAELPFAPIKRRYTGYSKYQERVRASAHVLVALAVDLAPFAPAAARETHPSLPRETHPSPTRTHPRRARICAPRQITAGITAYNGQLREVIAGKAWSEMPALLEKGSKSKGNSKTGEGTGVAASALRSSCYAFGLFANTVLQSENDSGTTTANLLARHLINELYLSMDDIAAAAAKGDQSAAKEAWTRGKEYLNGYVRLVNLPINAKVGDKFLTVTESF